MLTAKVDLGPIIDVTSDAAMVSVFLAVISASVFVSAGCFFIVGFLVSEAIKYVKGKKYD